MFDFAWSEMAVIGVVALVVIGPKDLPRVLRTAGVMIRRARGMAREFQNSIDEMIREAELDEFRKEVEETRRSLEQAAHIDLPQFHDPLALPSNTPPVMTASSEHLPLPPRLDAPEADPDQLDLGLQEPPLTYTETPHPHAFHEDPPRETPPSPAAEPELPLSETPGSGQSGIHPPAP